MSDDTENYPVVEEIRAEVSGKSVEDLIAEDPKKD